MHKSVLRKSRQIAKAKACFFMLMFLLIATHSLKAQEPELLFETGPGQLMDARVDDGYLHLLYKTEFGARSPLEILQYKDGELTSIDEVPFGLNGATYLRIIHAVGDKVWYVANENARLEPEKESIRDLTLFSWSPTVGHEVEGTISADLGVGLWWVKDFRNQVVLGDRRFAPGFDRLVEVTETGVKVLPQNFEISEGWAGGLSWFKLPSAVDGEVLVELHSAGQGYSSERKHRGLAHVTADSVLLIHSHEISELNEIIPFDKSVLIGTDLSTLDSSTKRPTLLRYTPSTKLKDTLYTAVFQDSLDTNQARPAKILGRKGEDAYYFLDDVYYRATHDSFESVDISQVPLFFDDEPKKLPFSKFYGDWKYAYQIANVNSTDVDMVRKDSNGHLERFLDYASLTNRGLRRPVVVGDAVFFTKSQDLESRLQLMQLIGEKVEVVTELPLYNVSIHDYNDDTLYFIAEFPDPVSSEQKSGLFSLAAFVSPVSIESGDIAKKKSSWELYPNPVKEGGSITLHSDVELIEKINIYDALGRLVLTEEPSPANSYLITNSQLPKGVYFAKIEFSGTVQSSKFVIY